MKQPINFLYIIASLLVVFVSCKPEEVDVLWQNMESNTTQKINDIFFLNDTVGYAVGGTRYERGVILKTTNRGQTWSEFILPDAQTLFDIQFVDDSIGYVVGYGGKIARTEDAGHTWVLLQYHTWETFHAIFISDDETILVVGGDGYANGVMLRSDSLWYDYDRDEVETSSFRDIAFPRINNGYMCGYGVVYKTSDLGISWQPTGVKGDFFTSMSFPDEHTGYICGYQGSILKTSDGGHSWERQKKSNRVFSQRTHFEEIAFFDPYTGIVCGLDGEAYLTQNGGTDWQKINIPTSVDFHATHLLSQHEALLAGEGGNIFLISW